MSKAMSIAVVGVYFEDILYNGGKATNLFFQRYKSAKRIQRKIVCNNNVIIKNDGGVHYIGCNITGSNYGTSKYQKIQLKMFF